MLFAVAPSLVLSFSVAWTIPDNELAQFFDDYLYPGSSTLLGITIGAIGLYFVVLYAINPSDKRSSVKKKKLRRVTKALGENMFWSVVFFVGILFIPKYKIYGIWYLSWTIIPFSIDRTMTLNAVWLLLVCFLVIALLDTLAATFSMLRQALFKK